MAKTAVADAASAANPCRPAPPVRAFRLLPPLILTGLLHACAWQAPLREAPLPLPDRDAASVERNRFALGENDSVVGQLATVPVASGDTLPDIARHFGLGFEEIGAANPGLDPWVPEAGRRLVLPLQFVLPDAPRKGIVVNLAAMRMFVFPAGRPGEVLTFPVGIGREGRSTPTGEMFVERKAARPVWYVPESIRRDHERKGDPLPAAVLPGPDNPLGAHALYLSRPAYLIHGTNKPYSIGLRASNGCLRLYPEDIENLYQRVPLRTPVHIVNQPYLIGRQNGEIYLEVHVPHGELNPGRLKAELYAKLKALEKKRGLTLDWRRVETVVREARGVPLPVTAAAPGPEQVLRQALALNSPERLYGRPSPPEPAEMAWYVRTPPGADPLDAQRLAAMLNHQGPRIPARAVMLEDGRYGVYAGPFRDGKSAGAAAKRMRIDLELDARVVAPGKLRGTVKDLAARLP